MLSSIQRVKKLVVAAKILHEGVMFNPTALRKAKIVYNFDLSESRRVNRMITSSNSFIIQ